MEVKLRVSGLDRFFADAHRVAKEIDSGDFSERGSVIAFESMELLLKVLTANRWQLLRALRREGPTSIRRLSQVLARDYRGVHGDVHALLDAGLIERGDKGEIFVPWDKITAEMAIDLAA
jgi:predicted transcriptional regulator